MVDHDEMFLVLLGFERSVSAMALVAIVVFYVDYSVELPDLCTQIVSNSAEIKRQSVHCSTCLLLKATSDVTISSPRTHAMMKVLFSA